MSDPRPPAESPSTVVSTRHLGVRYGSLAAIRDVNLEVPRGQITALIGPSGCGKSSFLMSINRLTDLVAGCRVEGRVLLDGEDIHTRGIDLTSLRRRVGMIFQKPNPFPVSIRRNLELPLRESGIVERSRLQALIESSLADVGLWDEIRDRLDEPALALSGGQQQRLCIARALALDPEVVLLDEPCSSLDPISSGVVEDRILALRGRLTIVIVTHNLPQARRIADRVAFFWIRDGAGTLIEAGPASRIFQHPSHRLTAAYLKGERG